MVATAHDVNRERHWTCARRLSERRRDLGLTQSGVVDRLVAQGTVATNRTLSAMEHGQGVDVGRLPELAIALDCTVTYLLGLTDEPHRWAPDSEAVSVVMDPRDSGEQQPAKRAAEADGAPTDGTVHVSWILGPDIPERRNPAPSARRHA